MTTFTNLIAGFGEIATAQCYLMIIFGTFLGIIIGALPGLTATTGVSIFLPMTFFMDPVPGISFLLGIYCGGMYGGSITAILINTPGTPAGAATVLDGYPLGKQGQAIKALEMALYASVVGGLISAFLLITISPQLAKIALAFGPSEYFALGLFGLTIVASLSGGNLIKGLLSACIGLFLSFIGLDIVSGTPRFTFGTVSLQNGFSLIPTLIGVFAMSEVLLQIEGLLTARKDTRLAISGEHLTFGEFRHSLLTIIKGSLIGAFVGAVPATGGGVAAFMSYNEAKRSSKDGAKFGTGVLEGVAASESANNGVTGATLIPLLTLSIPGDAVTAVLLGALMVQGLTPGPMLFENHADTVFGLYAALIIANIVMLIQGKIGIRFFYRVTKIPKSILQPIIFALCAIGAFASNTRSYELICMFAMGLLGYLMVKAKLPVAPVLLALILGPTTESNLRRGLLSTRGSFLKLINRPITLLVLGLALLSVVISLRNEYRASKARQAEQEALEEDATDE